MFIDLLYQPPLLPSKIFSLVQLNPQSGLYFILIINKLIIYLLTLLAEYPNAIVEVLFSVGIFMQS